jgi:XTP/dITP diphosphohydrolase
MIRMQITAATANPAKLLELQALVGECATVVPLPANLQHLACSVAPDERGETIEEIAAAKAAGWSRVLAARQLDSLTIASDGGLLIPALGEAWDPRFTRRFAGDRASDTDRARYLLALTRHLTGDERSIAWREAVAIADQGALVGVWTASGAPGRLATTVRDDLLDRTPGFWIPSIWDVPESGFHRLAELTGEERAHLDDHWRRLQEPVRNALASFVQKPTSHNDRASAV